MMDSDAVNANLSATSHINCIVACLPDKRCLSHGMSMMTLHFFNDDVNDVESKQKTIQLPRSRYIV